MALRFKDFTSLTPYTLDLGVLYKFQRPGVRLWSRPSVYLSQTWKRRWDLNPRPLGYEPSKLPLLYSATKTL